MHAGGRFFIVLRLRVVRSALAVPTDRLQLMFGNWKHAFLLFLGDFKRFLCGSPMSRVACGMLSLWRP